MNCSMGYYPCVGGPMSGRLEQIVGGKYVIFPVRAKRGWKRAVYIYANGKCGDTEWTYLKFNGWEKIK